MAWEEPGLEEEGTLHHGCSSPSRGLQTSTGPAPTLRAQLYGEVNVTFGSPPGVPGERVAVLLV